VALSTLGMDPAVGAALSAARQRFTDALPGIKHMRDALMHFDEWSRGEGKFGPQKQRRDAGAVLRDVAREYWGFGYDPGTGTISLGPYTINVDNADRAAAELSHAIYLAAHEVDRKNVAELRAMTMDALADAQIHCNAPDAALTVSPGNDLHVWLTLNAPDGSNAAEREALAERIVTVLEGRGLRLKSTNLAESLDSVKRLVQRETLYVVADPSVTK
jgi:hypothetical protein